MIVETVLGVMDQKCVICKNNFSMRSELEKHVRNKHGNRAEFECEICKDEFGEEHELKEHEIEVINDQNYFMARKE